MSRRYWFFLALLSLPPAIAKKSALDYAKFNVPLYDQVKARIRANILAKIDSGPKTDRFFFAPFAYQDLGNHANQSHTFATVIKVGVQHTVEHFTISWLPDHFRFNLDLCVFKPLLSLIHADWNGCRPETGRNFSLEETLRFALSHDPAHEATFNRLVAMWGPYEIKKPFFAIGVARKNLLESGKIKYIADDRIYSGDLTAINCFHAIESFEPGFPLGGFLNTGFKMWGINGTSRVLSEYKAKASRWIDDPIDEKDMYGFVYSSTRASKPKYPFQHASAFHL